VGEISLPIIEALPTTEARNTFDDHPLRGWWSWWIDKKERKDL